MSGKNDRHPNRTGLDPKAKKGGHGGWGSLDEAPKLEIGAEKENNNPRDPNFGGN